MKEIKNLNFDAERALYASRNLSVVNCTFAGEAEIVIIRTAEIAAYH